MKSRKIPEFDPWATCSVRPHNVAEVANPAKADTQMSNISHFSKFSSAPARKLKIIGPIDDSIDMRPAKLPSVQNHCAGCGKYIPVYDTNWIHLADGALIHNGGPHGDKCKQGLERNLSAVKFYKPES
jgi:hypothetical protein